MANYSFGSFTPCVYNESTKTWDEYVPCIYNGTTWEEYEAYIYSSYAATSQNLDSWNESLNALYAENATNGDSSTVPVRYTKNKIDVSDYNKITFTISNFSYLTTYATFCVSSSTNINGSVAEVCTEGVFQKENGTIELDVSDLSGSYYVVIQLEASYKNGGYITIEDVVMT